ncbi:hypothetical protein U1763_20870 [Sphingomonas sp. LB2R24]
MAFDRERDYPSRWATVVSIAEKIGCVPQTFHDWVKRAEVNSGMRAAVPAMSLTRVSGVPLAPCGWRRSMNGLVFLKRRKAYSHDDVM